MTWLIIVIAPSFVTLLCLVSIFLRTLCVTQIKQHEEILVILPWHAAGHAVDAVESSVN